MGRNMKMTIQRIKRVSVGPKKCKKLVAISLFISEIFEVRAKIKNFITPFLQLETKCSKIMGHFGDILDNMKYMGNNKPQT